MRDSLPPIDGVEVHTIDNDVDLVAVQKAKHTLIDMSQDYEFFYLGVLSKHAGWLKSDLASNFCQLLAKCSPAPPIAIDYVEPFVTNLAVADQVGDMLLARRLHAIPKESAKLFRDMLGSCAFFDRETRFFAHTTLDIFDIIDPFALKAMRVVMEVPTVSVTFVGLSTTRGHAHIMNRYPVKPSYRLDPPVPGIQNVANHYTAKTTDDQ